MNKKIYIMLLAIIAIIIVVCLIISKNNDEYKIINNVNENVLQNNNQIDEAEIDI